MFKITITRNIGVEAATAFDYILPIDLSHIFRRYSFLPGISHTTWQSIDVSKQTWKEGISRIVHFDDCSTADETMTKVIANQSFEYVIANWNSALKLLVNRIEGKFVFNSISENETNIVWTYTLFPQNFVSSWIVKLLILPRLKIVLNNALDIIQADLIIRK